MRHARLIAAGTALPLMLAVAACNAPETDKAEPAETPGEPAAAPPARGPVGANATAVLASADGTPMGRATFRQGATGLVIRVEATGLTPGWHGMHLHAVQTCEGPKFDSAGSHVQHGGTKVPHGLLNAEGPDAGDLPNLYVGADGRGFAEVFTTAARLGPNGPGENLVDADGSAFLIHAGPDDHEAQPIGGSGDRVACGSITVA